MKNKCKKIIIVVSIVSFIISITFSITFIIINNKQKLVKYNKEITNIKNQYNSAIIAYNEVIEYKTEWTYDN